MNTARRLTRAQLRDLADDLRSQRARLERSIAMRMEASDVAPASENHIRGHSPGEGGLATVLEARALDRHEQLDSALRRLEAGTYGVCVSCHLPIAYARLLVMPEATYCVGCGSGA